MLGDVYKRQVEEAEPVVGGADGTEELGGHEGLAGEARPRGLEGAREDAFVEEAERRVGPVSYTHLTLPTSGLG